MHLISVVVPVFNEAESIPKFIEQITKTFAEISSVELELIFINDGSTDETLNALLTLQSTGINYKIIDLSRNFGKEAALTAGLDMAEGTAVIIIDVDLQDPPEIIPEMIEKWKNGWEVVIGKRADRNSDSWSKRTFAQAFYKFHNIIADTKIPENVGDFRIMDISVVNAIKTLPESRRFMKGIFAWAGFRTTTIEFTRLERAKGTSKFNGWRLWTFAIEGLTSFSTAPLKIWTYIGIFVSLFSFIFAFYTILGVIMYGIDTPGYASTIVSVTLIGGLQLIGIGIIGEYLGLTYIESKRRPAYLVRKKYTSNKHENSKEQNQ